MYQKLKCINIPPPAEISKNRRDCGMYLQENEIIRKNAESKSK